MKKILCITIVVFCFICVVNLYAEQKANVPTCLYYTGKIEDPDITKPGIVYFRFIIYSDDKDTGEKIILYTSDTTAEEVNNFYIGNPCDSYKYNSAGVPISVDNEGRFVVYIGDDSESVRNPYKMPDLDLDAFREPFVHTENYVPHVYLQVWYSSNPSADFKELANFKIGSALFANIAHYAEFAENTKLLDNKKAPESAIVGVNDIQIITNKTITNTSIKDTSITNTNINYGDINNVTIGATAPAKGTFTTLNADPVITSTVKAKDGSGLKLYDDGGNGVIVKDGNISFPDVTKTAKDIVGITWHDASPESYGIYRTSGTWTSPLFQQIKFKWITGIVLQPAPLDDAGYPTGYPKSYVEIVGGKGLKITSGNIGKADAKLTLDGDMSLLKGAIPTPAQDYWKLYVNTNNKLCAMDGSGKEYDLTKTSTGSFLNAYTEDSNAPATVNVDKNGLVQIGDKSQKEGKLTVFGWSKMGSDYRTLCLKQDLPNQRGSYRFIDCMRPDEKNPSDGADSEFIVYSDGNVKADGTFSSPADYAEWFETKDKDLEPGDLVSIDQENPNFVAKTKLLKDNFILGIISTKPGILGTLADDVTKASEERERDPYWKKVGLLGQVPVKVTGNIAVGNYITSSNIPGVGMKAEPGASTVAVALEPHEGNEIGKINCLIARNNTEILSGLINIDNNNVGIGVKCPKNPLEMKSGAYVTAGGVWMDASSIEYKTNIASLSLDKANEVLTKLNPVTFSYKLDPVERHAGFIAEEVPEILAGKDRKGLSPMDIVAILTKVVQQQQKEIEELKKQIKKF